MRLIIILELYKFRSLLIAMARSRRSIRHKYPLADPMLPIQIMRCQSWSAKLSRHRAPISMRCQVLPISRAVGSHPLLRRSQKWAASRHRHQLRLPLQRQLPLIVRHQLRLPLQPLHPAQSSHQQHEVDGRQRDLNMKDLMKRTDNRLR